MPKKLYKASVLEEKQPKTAKKWIQHGISEFIGAFIISFALSGLSLTWYNGEPIEHFFGHKLFLGFIEGFIIKGSLILILIRWSVDINPAVSGYKILIGHNTKRYGLFKIILQLLGGVLAGLITMWIGTEVINHPSGIINHAVSIQEIQESFLTHSKPSIEIILTFLFFVELLITMIYLFPIFSKSIHNEYRDLIIMLIISLNTLIGFSVGAGAGAANPSRTIAFQLPHLIQGIGQTHHHFEGMTYGNYVTESLLMLGAGFAAPFIYSLIHLIIVKDINPLIHKIVNIKNTRIARINRDLSSTSNKYEKNKKKHFFSRHSHKKKK